VTWPDLRVEDGLIIGRSSGRLWRRWRRHAWRRLVCWARGHKWGEWMIDMDGPGEWLDERSFMPYCSRESRPGEYGLRVCERRCGTSEARWPTAIAPSGWLMRL
jgi:hypothetical protein